MIFQRPVTDTIQWDGPASLAAYQEALTEKATAVTAGAEHFFTILYFGEGGVGGADGDAGNGIPAGSISLRPESAHRANIGLWIGERFHGLGLGSAAVREILAYGFDTLSLERIEAAIFVGNLPSRRIFEKNGFALEGTLRSAVCKRGAFLDEWLLAITRSDWALRGKS